MIWHDDKDGCMTFQRVLLAYCMVLAMIAPCEPVPNWEIKEGESTTHRLLCSTGTGTTRNTIQTHDMHGRKKYCRRRWKCHKKSKGVKIA